MSPAGVGVEPGVETPRHEAAPRPRESVGLAGVADGAVKWVDASRGHGAIATELTAPWDIWFHVSSIEGQGFRLSPGDRVQVGYLRLDLDSFRYVAHMVKVVEPAA